MGDIGKFTIEFADGTKRVARPPSTEEFDKWLAKEKALHGEYKVTPEKMVDAPIMSRLSGAAGTARNLARTPILSAGMLAKNPALLGAFIPESKPMRESAYNSMSDLAGEIGGSIAGAITGAGVGAPLGPVGSLIGAVTGAGMGGVAGDQAAEDWQSKVKGTTPEPRTLGRGGSIFARNAGGELIGRGIFDVAPAIRRWTLRGGAPPDIMMSNIDLLKSMGHPPRLDLVAKGGLFDWGGVYNWAAKSGFSADAIHSASNRALRDMRARYSGLLGVNRAGEVVLPDVTSTGRFIERGLKRQDDLWYDKAKVLYDDFERVFPPNTRIPWTNLSDTLDDLTSKKNPLVKPLVTQRLDALNATVNQQYGYQLVMPSGAPINIKLDAPFEELKELRSRVGELLGRVDPNPDLPRAELKRVYAALSKDLRAGAARNNPEYITVYRRGRGDGGWWSESKEYSSGFNSTRGEIHEMYLPKDLRIISDTEFFKLLTQDEFKAVSGAVRTSDSATKNAIYNRVLDRNGYDGFTYTDAMDGGGATTYYLRNPQTMLKTSPPSSEALRKFDRANNFYSAKMRIVETTLEDFYKKFSAAGGTPAELSATLSGIVNGRDVVKAAHLKAALGANSPEWDHARKYIFSEMMFPQRAVDGTVGDPNVLYAIRRLSKMDDKMRTVLLGKEGTELRDSMEAIIEASRRMPGFGSAPVTQYSRFTQAEAFGPLNIALATGAGVATKSIPGGFLIFGALALMTPKYATRLLLNEKVIRNLARGMQAPAVDIGPMITRLSADVTSMDDDDAAALTQFLAGMSGMLNGENYQQQPGQPAQQGGLSYQGSILNPGNVTAWQGR